MEFRAFVALGLELSCEPDTSCSVTLQNQHLLKCNCQRDLCLRASSKKKETTTTKLRPQERPFAERNTALCKDRYAHGVMGF